ncbi:DNA methyltransferase [Pseudoroseomonas cervicalis]|uniref:DNA methyltransferase n=1 Tax=Teichococcus cervicalis TaxID=204525 RepID=UPI0022F18E7C|nr:DNA methyltransferase [Pseudoroseomonas cervicalis]WBV43526.1 DNA methyltransferase [Pseudoroseomonas cervicalis]
MQRESWDDQASNAEQSYLTHGVFRYFGKLPPTLTRRILSELNVGPGTTVADVMCGSGTTVVEAVDLGAAAIGVDCNDLSALITRVKTTPLTASRFEAIRLCLRREFADVLASGEFPLAAGKAQRDTGSDTAKLGAPKIRNIDHWFHPTTIAVLVRLRAWLETLPEGAERDAATVAFAASIRPASRASVRTGRLFVDVDKKLPNPVIEFERRLDRMQEAIAPLAEMAHWRKPQRTVMVGDARSTGLEAGTADVVFCHPPYFALYRYSSDPLRFELDWLGLDRKVIASREVEDGFKTTDETLVRDHIKDMVDVAAEARRIAKPRGRLVVVTADSTLRKERLDILDPLTAEASQVGWRLTRRILRKVRYAQASYHRSADQDIQRPDDEILIFEAA